MYYLLQKIVEKWWIDVAQVRNVVKYCSKIPKNIKTDHHASVKQTFRSHSGVWFSVAAVLCQHYHYRMQLLKSN